MKGLLLFAILGVVVPAVAQQQYYVWDGSNLQPLFNTQGLVCDHWAIWLYTDDTTDPQPAKGWGEIDGASAGEVQEKYQKERDNIERLLTSNHTGYEVHLGPVAIIKPPPQSDNPMFGATSKEEDDLCDRLIKDFDLANRLMDAAKQFQGYYYQDQQGGYYLKPKSDLQEYLESLHEIMEKINELRHKLNDVNGPPLAEIQGQLDALNQSLATTESQGQALASKFQSNSDSSGNDTSWSGKTCLSSILHEKIILSGQNIVDYHGYDDPDPQRNPGFVNTIVLDDIKSALLYDGQYSAPYKVRLDFKVPPMCASLSNNAQPVRTDYNFLEFCFDTKEDAAHFYQYIQSHVGRNQ